MTTIDFAVPTSAGPFQFKITQGSSVVFIGANGAGKTRLGVLLELGLGGSHEVHRVAAHRSLVLNTNVQPSSYEKAERMLFYGNDEGRHDHRSGHRWANKPATALLSDFDHVVRALYADENQTSVLHRQKHLNDITVKPPTTKLDRLKTIWQSLLPHRELIVSAGDIKVSPTGSADRAYDASNLSDGERVIFYLLGQCLLVKPSCIIIIDEPELHIHRAILAKLWDEIETERKDCAFVYLTHDLEFATSRHAALKIALRNFTAPPEQWELQLIPEDTNIPEDVVSKILGSRQPVLFVEGDAAGLDASIYRKVWANFTVIPVGPCDHVIHSVTSFTKHAALHRIGCAGLIDADDGSQTEIEHLQTLGVYTLPVSEVENLLLLPEIFTELAKVLKFDDKQAAVKLAELQTVVLKEAQAGLHRFAIEYTKRRIDRTLKTLGLKAKDVAALDTEFKGGIAKTDPNAIYTEVANRLTNLVGKSDYYGVLRLYDNKGFLAEAARIFDLKNRKAIEEFIGRTLRSDEGKKLLSSLVSALPKIVPVSPS